jgi:predicted phosphoribosyltransferase
VVCLQAPDFFYAVGRFLEDFSQVSDAEVVANLRHSGPKLTAGA